MSKKNKKQYENVHADTDSYDRPDLYFAPDRGRRRTLVEGFQDSAAEKQAVRAGMKVARPVYRLPSGFGG